MISESNNKTHRLYCAGDFVETDKTGIVVNPFDPNSFKKIFLASEKHIHQAISRGIASERGVARLTPWQKKHILLEIAEQIKFKKTDFITAITFESGKPKKYAELEVKRAIQTFLIAAEETLRSPAEYISLDWEHSSPRKDGIVKYFPIGLVAGISPFNFPLNLVAHKVAPALAAGCPIIIKPASKTPITALMLAEIIDKTAWPKGAFSVLPCERKTGDLLVKDEGIKLLSFTGSPKVGWEMKNKAGKKKIVLELGGNAGAIVHRDADLKKAVKDLLIGGFAYSGQVCIHTQRVLIQEDVYNEFKQSFLKAVKSFTLGNPSETSTDFSCVIDDDNAERILSWVNEAVDEGAEILCGGKRKGNMVEPTLLEGVPHKSKIYAEEVFGPVVILESYKKIEDAVDIINASKFGLQAAVYTDSQKNIDYCFEYLQVGGVILNGPTTYRADHMPYGGIKDSGLGREGIKYAIHDMLEPKILVKDRI